MTALFISDLHLDESHPELTDVLLRFLATIKAPVDSLYLLGDIFEVWIGDDNQSPLNVGVAQALKAVSEKGISIYFMHGNRDFLVKQAYAEQCGMALLEDPSIITLGGIKTLLSHGDLYCTDDLKYQAFRLKSRSAAWQKKMLRLPLWIRKALAKYARSRSKKHHVGTLMISDVVAAEISQAMQAGGVKRMIHGHTHRPAVHQVELDTDLGERIVLADWRIDSGEALEVSDTGEYRRIPLR